MTVIIAIFIIIELWLFGAAWSKNSKLIKNEISQIEYIQKKLKQGSDEAFKNIPENKRNHFALEYLCSSAETGQLINTEDFSKLIRNPTQRAMSSLNSAINLLPIIGLIGTFLGIIIGLFGMNSTMQIDSNNINETISPLLESAMLAFISSVVALFLAGILKWIMGNLQTKSEDALSKAESLLVSSYLTQVSTTDTSDMLAKTVRRLNRSIDNFVKNFSESYSGFLQEFKPLVEDQKNTNAQTVKMIENVSQKLEDNSKALLEITQQQKAQSDSFNLMVDKLQAATDSVEKTIEIATKNLEGFIALSSDMKNSISEMHEPLNKIISDMGAMVLDNKKIITEMTSLISMFSNVSDYLKSIQLYQASLNNKLDTFAEVGNKVYDVKKQFDEFDVKVAQTLDTFISQANLFSDKMRNSFDDYDRQLRTLFQELQNKDNTQLFYYDPDLMNSVKSQIAGLEKVLEKQQAYADTLQRSTLELLKSLQNMGIWGFFKRRKDKKEIQHEKQ